MSENNGYRFFQIGSDQHGVSFSLPFCCSLKNFTYEPRYLIDGHFQEIKLASGQYAQAKVCATFGSISGDFFEYFLSRLSMTMTANFSYSPLGQAFVLNLISPNPRRRTTFLSFSFLMCNFVPFSEFFKIQIEPNSEGFPCHPEVF